MLKCLDLRVLGDEMMQSGRTCARQADDHEGPRHLMAAGFRELMMAGFAEKPRLKRIADHGLEREFPDGGQRCVFVEGSTKHFKCCSVRRIAEIVQPSCLRGTRVHCVDRSSELKRTQSRSPLIRNDRRMYLGRLRRVAIVQGE